MKSGRLVGRIAKHPGGLWWSTGEGVLTPQWGTWR